MKRIDLYRAQLKAAQAEHKIRLRNARAAFKAYLNVTNRVTDLENKIATIMAKTE